MTGARIIVVSETSILTSLEREVSYVVAPICGDLPLLRTLLSPGSISVRLMIVSAKTIVGITYKVVASADSAKMRLEVLKVLVGLVRFCSSSATLIISDARETSECTKYVR